ncbi:MAG: hypothetical protein WC558_07360 [Patulibacter sp.]
MSCRRVIAALALALVVPSAASAASYSVRYGAELAPATFRVGYEGSGTWRTSFRATPPNPGGKADANAARDSSTQRWDLTFRRPLVVPACGVDPVACAAVVGPVGASGGSRVVGRIDHHHDDGLYRDLDRTVRCTVRTKPPRTRLPEPAVRVRYDAATARFAIGAVDPVGGALGSTPMACPGQGDPIDRILDNYFLPGFSFAAGWGPERWFTPVPVSIPAATLLRAERIVIRLRDARANTPPRGCARPTPRYERCSTGGTWSGRLTLTRVG